MQEARDQDTGGGGLEDFRVSRQRAQSDARSKGDALRLKVCQRVPQQGHDCEAWRYERIQGRQLKGTTLHLDRDSILCESRDLAR
jgi:hypothetical protein